MSPFSDTLTTWALFSVLLLNALSAFAGGRNLTGWAWVLLAACALAGTLSAPRLGAGEQLSRSLQPVRLTLFFLLAIPAAAHYLAPSPKFSGSRLALLPLATFMGMPGDDSAPVRIAMIGSLGFINLRAALAALKPLWGQKGRSLQTTGINVPTDMDELPPYLAPSDEEIPTEVPQLFGWGSSREERLARQAAKETAVIRGRVALQRSKNELQSLKIDGRLIDLDGAARAAWLRVARAQGEMVAASSELEAKKVRDQKLDGETERLLDGLKKHLRTLGRRPTGVLVAAAKRYLIDERDRAVRDEDTDLASRIESAAPAILAAVRTAIDSEVAT